MLSDPQDKLIHPNLLSQPTVRGEITYIRINEEVYQKRLESCRNNLIGRLLLRKGSQPIPLENLKMTLESLWKPDFDPYATTQHTHAQVWRKIYGLSYEYWDPRIIMEIAKGVGIPLQLDKATKEGTNGFYARVLVDVDFQTIFLPTSW